MLPLPSFELLHGEHALIVIGCFAMDLAQPNAVSFAATSVGLKVRVKPRSLSRPRCGGDMGGHAHHRHAGRAILGRTDSHPSAAWIRADEPGSLSQDVFGGRREFVPAIDQGLLLRQVSS